jgi:hypothetical protein
MNLEKQTLIEQRAYALWQREGRPHGRHEEHWHRAAREVEAEEEASLAKAPSPGRNSREGKLKSRSDSPKGRKKAKA